MRRNRGAKPAPTGAAKQQTKPVRRGAPSSVGSVSAPKWAYEAESTVSQSRENTTCPPATVDSFAGNHKVGRQRCLKNLGLAAAVLVLMTSCSASPTSEGSSNPETLQVMPSARTKLQTDTSTSTTPSTGKADVNTKSTRSEPTPKVKDPADYSGAAFEQPKGASVQIQRSGPAVKAGDQLAAKRKTDAQAVYKDGVSVHIKSVAQGKVKNEGPGFFTGAPYQVFEITLGNHSKSTLDISSVVVTLRLDKGRKAALPLYGEVKAFDFVGTLGTSSTTSTRYAFIVPEGIDSAQLAVDLDGIHAPAVFTVRLVKQ